MQHIGGFLHRGKKTKAKTGKKLSRIGQQLSRTNEINNQNRKEKHLQELNQKLTKEKAKTCKIETKG